MNKIQVHLDISLLSVKYILSFNSSQIKKFIIESLLDLHLTIQY